MKKYLITPTLFILIIVISLCATSINTHAEDGTIPTVPIQFMRDVPVILRLAQDSNKNEIVDAGDKLFASINWTYELQYEYNGIIIYTFVGQLNKLETYQVPFDKNIDNLSVKIFSPTNKIIKFTTNYTAPFEGEYIYLDSSNAYYQLNFTFSSVPETFSINNFEYVTGDVPIGATITNPCTENDDNFNCNNSILTDTYIGITDEFSIETYNFNLIYPDLNADWRINCYHATNPEIIEFSVIGNFNRLDYNFDLCLKNKTVFLPIVYPVK